MTVQDYCAERGEAKKDKTEDGIDEAEKDRADAVWDETNNDDQRGEPGRQARTRHQDSAARGVGAEDRMGDREPVGRNTNPVNYG